MFNSSQSQGRRSDWETWRWWIVRGIFCFFLSLEVGEEGGEGGCSSLIKVVDGWGLEDGIDMVFLFFLRAGRDTGGDGCAS